MMIEQQHWTHKEQRVRLKDEAEGLYAAAYSFSPGTVKKHKKDSLGYPMVYIEWDKTSWLYNGEKDGWAFESHFEPDDRFELEDTVKETPMPDSNGNSLPPEVMKALVAWAASQAEPDQIPEPEPDKTPESDPEKRTFMSPAELKTLGVTDENFAEMVADGAAQASDADAVLILTVKSTPGDHGTEYEPHLHIAYKKADAGVVLEMQLAKVVAGAMHDAGLMSLKLLKDKTEE